MDVSAFDPFGFSAFYFVFFFGIVQIGDHRPLSLIICSRVVFYSLRAGTNRTNHYSRMKHIRLHFSRRINALMILDINVCVAFLSLLWWWF